jgi:hypothetical protein
MTEARNPMTTDETPPDHPILRMPHPDGAQPDAWWQKMREFLDEELGAAYEAGMTAGLGTAEKLVAGLREFPPVTPRRRY